MAEKNRSNEERKRMKSPAKAEAREVEEQDEDAPAAPSGPPGRPRAEKSKNQVVDLYTGVAERTFEESTHWADSQRKPYNPDDLVQKTGDYSIYEEMMDDDQVDVCLQIKRDLVVGNGWDIVPEVTDGSQDEIKADIQDGLTDDPDACLDDCIEEILSANGYGLSLSELLFKNRDDGSIALRNIKTRHPSTWEIHTDERGNIEKYVQHGPKGDIEVEPKSLIHYVNRRLFGNPYGRSDLRSAYNAWFVKRQVVRWYAIFLEKAASPTPIARYEKGANKQAIDDIHAAIKSLQTKTAMTIPKEVMVEFLESKSTGEAYQKAINIFNMFIGRALMIPDLLGFQGSETGGGAYSLGQEQFKLLFLHIQRRRANIERIVNRQIVWPIVVHNHGFVKNYPKFKLRPIDDQLVRELAKLWLECVKGKTYKPSDEEINHFRGIVKFPQGEVEREAPPPMVGPDGRPLPGQEGEGDEGDEPGGEKKAGVAPGGTDDPGAEKPDAKGKEKPAPEPEPKDEKKQFALKLYSALPGEYDRKVDYAAIQSTMDRFQSRVADESLPIVRRVYENLYDQIRSKKLLDPANLEKLQDVKLKHLADVRGVLKGALREGYRDGRQSGLKEILRGNFRAPLPDEKFLEFLEAETFQYIGDWSYDITKKARIRLAEAIRDGKSMAAVVDMLDDDGIPMSMTSIERFTRTKFTEVMNRGRLAVFQESGVVAGYQFSAILDDRVTEVCAGLHGKTFSAGDEPIPPLHFNCRSLLVPITRYEPFQADTEIAGRPINEFIQEKKGDGFARR